MIRITLAIVIMIVAVTSTAFASAHESRYVEVLGTVQRQIPSDRAFVIAEISATKTFAAEARIAAEAVQTGLSAMLAKHALPSEASSFTNAQIDRYYDYESGKRMFSGFRAIIRVTLRLDDIRVLTALNEFTSDAGDLKVVWVDLANTQEGEYRKIALRDAFAHARAKAEALAQQAERTLGGVEFVREEEVEFRSSRSELATNAHDPYEGKGIHPIGIFVRIRVRFELLNN